MAWIPLLVLFCLFFMGIPISYALWGAVICYFGILNREIPSYVIFENIAEAVKNPDYWALLLFMMAGSILRYSGAAKRFHRLAEALIGHLPGSLAQVNVVWSMFMGGVSGSANADCAMQSQLLVPEMEACGYSKGFSTAITAASSAVTPIIPPGINLLVYAAIVLPAVSIGEMFLAGLVPGILMTAALMTVVHVIARRRSYPAGRRCRAERSEIFYCVKNSFAGLLYPAGIILGLMSGLFSAPETALLAVCYSIFLGSVCYRELKRKHLLMIFRDTVEGAASVFLIILAARLFRLYLSTEAIPELLMSVMPIMMESRFAALIAVNLLLLVLGMFFEGGSILIVMAPLLLPIVSAAGVDPVHFGIICVMNTTIGGLTPPFGSMMLTCCSITGCAIRGFVKECLPFIGALLLLLGLITFLPALSIWFSFLR